MSVLAGIPFDQHINSIRAAADAIVAEGRRLCPGHAWSICEVKLSDCDVQWLHNWANALREDQIELSLRHVERRPAVGLLLLAFASENCRRDGRERGIYEVYADGGWDDLVRHKLFNPTGYPRTTVRESLEDACRCFGLRHAFDAPTTQPWYLTIKLQFGFTLPGARDHLEYWLVGTPPDAIELLLLGEPQSRANGTPIVSKSFGDLWRTLQHYRADRVRGDEARREIADSPWTLASWADHLLAAAIRPIAGAAVAELGSPRPNKPLNQAVDNSEEEPLILSQPRVIWDDGTIRFVSRFEDTFLSLLRGECFVVSLDGKGCDVLRKQLDGTYNNLTRNLEISLPIDSERVLLTVSDESGRGMLSQMVELFDGSDDFQAFNTSGRPVSAKHLTTERGYTLRFPTGSCFLPDEDLEQRYDAAGSRWVQLRPGSWLVI